MTSLSNASLLRFRQFHLTKFVDTHHYEGPLDLEIDNGEIKPLTGTRLK